MNLTPLFTTPSLADFGTLSVLRRWIHLIALALLIAPVCAVTMVLFTSLFQAGDAAKFISLLASTMISILLLFTIIVSVAAPYAKSVFWRILIGLLLAAPWAFVSLGIFSTLFPFQTAGSFIIRLGAGLTFSALALYGFRILFRPPGRYHRFPWRPDPPPGGTPVTAPLVPPTPVRTVSAAKELPRASDEFDSNFGQTTG